MTIPIIVFYFLLGTAAICAIALMLARHLFRGALLVIGVLLSLAGLYVLLFAEFLAVTQILIYAGGILVVIIFGIMLTNRTSTRPLQVTHANTTVGGVASLVLFGTLVYFLSKEPFLPTERQPAQDMDYIARTGRDLMTDYMLPFEIAGVLLLVALVGAAVVASTKTTTDQRNV